MSYYVLNEKRLTLPDTFNGIAVFYPKAGSEAEKEEQQVLFQRLFANGLGMDTAQMLWVEIDEQAAAFTLKNKGNINCCLFFGVDPGKAGFRVNLPMNQFVAVSHMQILLTASPKSLNEKPDMKKILWAALQVLK